jgi:hypothetical protein
MVNNNGDEEFAEVDVDPILWQNVNSAYKNAQDYKDKAYLVPRENAPPGVARCDLNTPTTYDRVRSSALLGCDRL